MWLGSPKAGNDVAFHGFSLICCAMVLPDCCDLDVLGIVACTVEMCSDWGVVTQSCCTEMFGKTVTEGSVGLTDVQFAAVGTYDGIYQVGRLTAEMATGSEVASGAGDSDFRRDVTAAWAFWMPAWCSASFVVAFVMEGGY